MPAGQGCVCPLVLLWRAGPDAKPAQSFTCLDTFSADTAERIPEMHSLVRQGCAAVLVAPLRAKMDFIW